MIKLVLTDLDDTLIPFGNSGVSDYARAAIHTLLEAGVRFGPVSGRPPHAMGWMFGDDPVCYATGAFANGMVIYADGRHIRTVEIAPELVMRVYEEVDALEGVFFFRTDIVDDAGSTYITSRPESIERYRKQAPTMRYSTELGSGPFVKVGLHFVENDPGYVAEVRDLLSARIPELLFFRPSNTVPAIDVTPVGWGKGAAALALGEELGIAPDEIAVFGDSENDLDMLSAVPHSVAVANGAVEVREAASCVIGDCRDEAVADALLEIAEASPAGRLPAFLRPVRRADPPG